MLFTIRVVIVIVMEVGRRLRELRKSARLSQGELEGRTGLLRCYTSRVENGHTVPTIEKCAISLGIVLATFFSKNGSPAEPPSASEDLRLSSTTRERFHSHKLAAALAARESRSAVTRRIGSTIGKRQSNETAQVALSRGLTVKCGSSNEPRRSPRIVAYRQSTLI